MRVGIFGGTFNPIHLGHLIVAEEMRERLKLDKVLFLLAFNPPHKKRFADYADRKAMVEKAIEGNPYFELSEIEKERGGKSWTVETLKDLRRRYPKDQIFLIIGSDQFQELTKWKNARELFNLARVCVMRRAGVPIGAKIKRIFPKALILDVSQIGISGREIRKKLKKGSSVRYLLPEKVYEYILRKGIYQKERL